MAYTEHHRVESLTLLQSRISEGSLNNYQKQQACRRSRSHPSFMGTTQGLSSSSQPLPPGTVAVEAVLGCSTTTACNHHVAHKRRRSAVVMEPGSMLSSTMQPQYFSSSVSLSNSESRSSHSSWKHEVSLTCDTVPRQRRYGSDGPQKLARKVSFDPLIVANTTPGRSVPHATSGRGLAMRTRMALENGHSPTPEMDDDHHRDHHHPIFQCFQPPMPRLATPSACANHIMQPQHPNWSMLPSQQPHLPSPHSLPTVSFSHDDLEPIPLDPCNGQHHQFTTNGGVQSHHGSKVGGGGIQRRHQQPFERLSKGGDDRASVAIRCRQESSSKISCAGTNTHLSVIVTGADQGGVDKRTICDDDEYPTWDIFDLEDNSTARLRDDGNDDEDDVLTYLESCDKEVSTTFTKSSFSTPMIKSQQNHSHPPNHHPSSKWELPGGTPAPPAASTTSGQAPDITPITPDSLPRPRRQRKLSSSSLILLQSTDTSTMNGKDAQSQNQHQSLSSSSSSTTSSPPDHAETMKQTLQPSCETPTSCPSSPTVDNKPYAMVQKKSRFKHYSSWGVLGTWGIRDIKKKLRELNLSTSGCNKEKLLDRLRQAWAKEG